MADHRITRREFVQNSTAAAAGVAAGMAATKLSAEEITALEEPYSPQAVIGAVTADAASGNARRFKFGLPDGA